MRRSSKALAVRATELAFAVPEVIAHRMLGADSREFHRMGTEKVAAFYESWTAMLVQSFWEAQRLASPASAALSIFEAGLKPIHRRARANARRLRRAKRRR